jgi:hypothetical protein
MSKNHQYLQMFAVIRIDESFDPKANVPEFEFQGKILHVAGPPNVTVKEVLQTAEEARSEVLRLNELNAGKKCKYYWQSTHVFINGGSHGPTS